MRCARALQGDGVALQRGQGAATIGNARCVRTSVQPSASEPIPALQHTGNTRRNTTTHVHAHAHVNVHVHGHVSMSMSMSMSMSCACTCVRLRASSTHPSTCTRSTCTEPCHRPVRHASKGACAQHRGRGACAAKQIAGPESQIYAATLFTASTRERDTCVVPTP